MPALRSRLLRLVPFLFLGTLTATLLLPPPLLQAQTSTIDLVNVQLPDTLVDSTYSANLQATGGVPPYTFQASSALPPGLTLSASGVVSGTPTVQKQNQVFVTILDSTGKSGQTYFILQVNASQISVSPAGPLTATYNTPYEQTITATGGTPPYSFGIGGAVSFPPGLDLSNSGVISGTPITPGTYNLILNVRDSSPVQNVASIPYPITITRVTSGLTIDASSGFTSDLGLHLNGAAAINGTSLTVADDKPFEASSAWSKAPVDISKFTTDFQFRITRGPEDFYSVADGFTFALQSGSPAAMGYLGGDLGYGGIPHSAAAKVDLFNNAGEQSNTVGFYTNGNTPTFPSSVLQNGVSLISGHLFQAHLTYDGISLTLTVMDTATHQSSTLSQVVDLPTALDSKQGYVGFTGGTGLFTSRIQILNWTYQNP